MIEQHGSLAEKFLKKGFWLYLFSYIIAPIGYIIKIIASNELSVSELGILYGVISLITLLSAFSDFGVPESLKYYMPKLAIKKEYGKIKSLLFYSFILQFLSSILLLCVFLFGADFLAENYFKDPQASGVLKIFSLYFLGINIFQIITQFFFSLQNTLYLKLSEFIRFIFILGSVLGLMITNQATLLHLSKSWILGLGVGVVFAVSVFFKNYYFPYLKGVKIYWDYPLAKKFFSYAIIAFLSAQAASILSQIDMQMILFLLGTTEAGQYTVYLSLISIPFIIIAPIFPLIHPVVSQIEDKKQINHIKNVFFKAFGIIALFFSIILLIFGEPLAFGLFGEKFIVSGSILAYSGVFIIFNFFLQVNYNILSGTGRVKYKLGITIIAVFINILLNYFLINSSFGVNGAALATGITWLCIWGMSEYILGLKDFQYLKSLIKATIISGLIYIIYILNTSNILSFFGESRIQNLIVFTLFSFIIFLIFIAFYKNEIGESYKYLKLKKGKS